VEELRLPNHRVPLGAFSFGGHQVLDARLDRGDLLLAYSDGVVDARSPDGEFFGEERLHGLLLDCPDDPADAVRRVLTAIEEFSSGQSPYDDVTLLAARWVG
jgi:sigma-B regulation protein RsbU (phosphoserine phosphatase)